MPKPSPITAKRKAAFIKIGQAIARLGDPNVPDWHTGKPSKFKIKNGASDYTRSWDSIETSPVMKTPQWLRTVK